MKNVSTERILDFLSILDSFEVSAYFSPSECQNQLNFSGQIPISTLLIKFYYLKKILLGSFKVGTKQTKLAIFSCPVRDLEKFKRPTSHEKCFFLCWKFPWKLTIGMFLSVWNCFLPWFLIDFHLFFLVSQPDTNSPKWLFPLECSANDLIYDLLKKLFRNYLIRMRQCVKARCIEWKFLKRKSIFLGFNWSYGKYSTHFWVGNYKFMEIIGRLLLLLSGIFSLFCP